MCSVEEEPFTKLLRELKLTEDDIEITYLTSFHEIWRKIVNVKNTTKYIYIEGEYSYRDGVDDYFKWHYITEERANNLRNNDKFASDQRKKKVPKPEPKPLTYERILSELNNPTKDDEEDNPYIRKPTVNVTKPACIQCSHCICLCICICIFIYISICICIYICIFM